MPQVQKRFGGQLNKHLPGDKPTKDLYCLRIIELFFVMIADLFVSFAFAVFFNIVLAALRRRPTHVCVVHIQAMHMCSVYFVWFFREIMDFISVAQSNGFWFGGNSAYLGSDLDIK